MHGKYLGMHTKFIEPNHKELIKIKGKRVTLTNVLKILRVLFKTAAKLAEILRGG
jgi:hypothetical protein